ncbi:MAG: dockerin type I domain-containing protein, partial [Planctomycetota bacterium]|nr:dockerin type I domain-containing protein [Planctomycetota bacterium]
RDSYVNGVLPSRTSQVITEYRRAGFMLPEPVPSFLVNGRAQHGGSIQPGADLAMGVEGLQRFVIRRQLFETDSPVSVCIPRNGNMGMEWTLPDYDEGSNGETWESGPGGVGYDTGDDYEDAINIDLLGEMRGNDGNPSAYIRIPFTLEDEAARGSIENLTLLIEFDDGFIAYLNGEPLASENPPDDGAEWDSRSRRSHEADIGGADAYELLGFEKHLRVGLNVLAIHGMNSSVNSSDFIIRAELVDRVIEVGLPADSVFYTLDGSDPRLPGGELSPTAVSYSGPATLTESTLVTARARGQNGDWSARVDAVFYTDMPLRVTEIMYNPAAPAEDSPFRRREFEFIELQNVSANQLDLTGVRFVEGIEFDFTESAVTALAPGEMVVLVEDIEGFASRYDLSRILVAGEYSGALSDGGERLSIRGPLDEPILDFEYSDLWHPETDGEGASLVVIDALDELATWGAAASWRPSNVDLGSPGVDESGLAPRGRQLPGDANQDARVDISDAVALLLHLFGRRPDLPPCGEGEPGSPANVAVLDSNGDNSVNVSDAVWLLAYMYQGGAPPTRGRSCIRLENCPNVCGF